MINRCGSRIGSPATVQEEELVLAKLRGGVFIGQNDNYKGLGTKVLLSSYLEFDKLS